MDFQWSWRVKGLRALFLGSALIPGSQLSTSHTLSTPSSPHTRTTGTAGATKTHAVSRPNSDAPLRPAFEIHVGSGPGYLLSHGTATRVHAAPSTSTATYLPSLHNRPASTPRPWLPDTEIELFQTQVLLKIRTPHNPCAVGCLINDRYRRRIPASAFDPDQPPLRGAETTGRFGNTPFPTGLQPSTDALHGHGDFFLC